ncbi:hypothetical protein FISHEDRAFT_12236, partial [Fistulina hepatica ATCC 64428]
LPGFHENSQYFVGCTTFVCPVRSPPPLGNAHIRALNASDSGPELESALRLDEIAFSAFYPADPAPAAEKGLHWSLRPLATSLSGFANFLGFSKWLLMPIFYTYGSLLQMPVYPNAPLLQPKPSQQWPLVIFSHGLGGSRTTYSQFCSRIAATGKVVLAIEHRDGTGIACTPRVWNADGSRTSRPCVYLRETDIIWPEEQTVRHPLRRDQLVMRGYEVYQTYKAFSALLENRAAEVEVETMDGHDIDPSWARRCDKVPSVKYDSDITLAGHSFGGCTVYSILSRKAPAGFTAMPITKALLLDPWLEPIPETPELCPFVDDGCSDATTKTGRDFTIEKTHPRMLVINSEVFTLWKAHFARLRRVVEAWEPSHGRIVTLVGSQHAHFSDFLLLPFVPGRSIAQTLMNVICDLSNEYLDGLNEFPRLRVRKTQIEIIGTKKDGSPKRKLVGEVGDVVI